MRTWWTLICEIVGLADSAITVFLGLCVIGGYFLNRRELSIAFRNLLAFSFSYKSHAARETIVHLKMLNFDDRTERVKVRALLHQLRAQLSILHGAYGIEIDQIEQQINAAIDSKLRTDLDGKKLEIIVMVQNLLDNAVLNQLKPNEK